MHSIGKASELSGVHIETIRYYEREGVLPKAERTESGRRIYSDDDIARMRFVRHCREYGFPIRDTRTLLSLTKSDTPCGSAQVIAREYLNSVRQKIADLSVLEQELDLLISKCHPDDAQCALLQELYGREPSTVI
ncbi:MerR family transcriptional regulator [Nitratireductor sp. XY-223]|uniref:MerR family transcriptional regulator n=1 Tax=Nitratireductor sp. XY-223 TaxID=2561926 RepID=UPI0010A9EAA8|nr:MerR family transcriptional regulator [Nitratireductor sp. XY-223]